MRIAIKAMEFRKRRYAVGHNSYLAGYRSKFTENDHKKHQELNEAIKEISLWLIQDKKQ
jgi:hypothetical protein